MSATLNDVTKKKAAEESAEQRAATELVRLAKDLFRQPIAERDGVSSLSWVDVGGQPAWAESAGQPVGR